MASHTPWQCLKQDIQRYGGWPAFWREQSLWAVAWFRLGSALQQSALPRPLKRIALIPWWLGFRLIETITGVSLPIGATIGGGLRIWHFGNVFVNANAVIGRNCTLRQGVTIGNRHPDGGSPQIGDDVEFGAYAQVLGPIQIGHHAKIGAMSVVLTDVPAHHTAVGAPARVLAPKNQVEPRA